MTLVDYCTGWIVRYFILCIEDKMSYLVSYNAQACVYAGAYTCVHDGHDPSWDVAMALNE